ncbi:T9SS type A sorting domain-containing protein [Aquimarina sp. MMG016]|uniref:T9SS type A sorting domain-containing protein n=1 Tax=Aquimarina sp. MMG016 TaxID=2822690 RepID=UPI001B3A0B5A|nr:T9SS type A sorting domain-containing protein [Aquimarina sp. MMG016]MBQ4820028.1 T9SS type A sorting domain-containing protein [Aquimarina sp. MMG016]
MKKVKLLISFSVILLFLFFSAAYFVEKGDNTVQAKKELIPLKKKGKKKEKTMEQRRRFAEERIKHEEKFQINSKTGKIPLDQKILEIGVSKNIMQKTITSKNLGKFSTANYISRGPSNLGGRTRSLVIDRSDASSNTIIAGGVSSGVFRTTNGGTSWTKVSPNNQIHNATTIVQDPRSGSENVWYYGTGEFAGNSASGINGGGASIFLGQGIWQSTDGGQNWAQIPSTSSAQEADDSPFDIIHKIVVHPLTGDLYAATRGAIRKFDGAAWTVELNANGNFFTDVVVTSTGTVYASIAGNSGGANEGVWQLPNGGNWSRIAGNGTPSGWASSGRVVLGIAPSNENIVYALYLSASTIPAGLFQFNDSSNVWTNYTSKMPDEPGGDSPGNDPISLQGGYDAVVSVKPDNENFVIIGGTNAYKIANITTDPTFTRIGGYRDNTGYSLYNLGGGDTHHPDIHALVFDPNNANILFSGTDGGIHRSDNITATTVAWNNLNNNYQTYQYYHVATDPNASSNIVIGGAQDNGTTAGGFNSSPNLTTMSSVAGGDGVAVAVSRDNDCVPFFLGFQNGDIFRDCPVEFTDITPTGSNSQFVTYFYLDPSNNNALYYAGRTNMYRNTQSSAATTDNWTDMGSIETASSSGTTNEWISQYAANWGTYNAASSYLMIGGDSGSLLRLDNPQNAANIAAAVDITPPGVGRNYPNVVSGIAIHPSNPDIALVTYSNYSIVNIFLTTNATAANPTWTIVERNLAPFSIRSAAITEIDNQATYFVGTARGLYSSTDPTTSDWVIESPDQIGFALVSSLAYKPSADKLLIGTHGNGMFEAQITPLSVEEFETNDTPFVAYPIPANDVINIDIEDTFVPGDLDYSIIDISGKIIKSGELNSEKQIGVQELTNGIYVLQLNSSNKSKAITFVKK